MIETIRSYKFIEPFSTTICNKHFDEFSIECNSEAHIRNLRREASEVHGVILALIALHPTPTTDNRSS